MGIPAAQAATLHAPHSDDLIALIRAEYREMPCLAVTLCQATRLWNIDRDQCFDALETLTTEGFLRLSPVRREATWTRR